MAYDLDAIERDARVELADSALPVTITRHPDSVTFTAPGLLPGEDSYCGVYRDGFVEMHFEAIRAVIIESIIERHRVTG